MLYSRLLFVFQYSKVSLKQAPGHNHKNTIFHLGHWPVNGVLYTLCILKQRVDRKRHLLYDSVRTTCTSERERK